MRGIDDVEAVVNELVVKKRCANGYAFRAGIIGRLRVAAAAADPTPPDAAHDTMKPFNPAEIEAAAQAAWKAADAYRAVETRRTGRSSSACRCCPTPPASCTWGTCATTRSAT